jgi:hypothetical protein
MAHKRLARAGTLGALAICLAFAATARGDEAAAKGRQVMEKWSKAVVSLRMVVKMRMSTEGREMEEEQQANEAKATVLDPSGLVVASLSDVDPSHLMQMSMAGESDFKMETELTDLKIRLDDGKEIPAKIVLRDKELDLVYVRPTEAPEAALPAVDFSAATQPGVLDEIIVLGRMGEAANLAPSASLDRILAVVEKPRTFYVPGLPTMMAGLGCPVFTLDGQAVGLVVVRSIPSEAGGYESRRGNTMAVVIPAADVTQGAGQAGP